MGNKQSLTDRVLNLCDSFSSDPDTLPSFSKSDVRLVQKVWVQVYSNVDQDVGVELFKRIFDKSQPIRNVFNVTAKDLANLDTNERFLRHTRNVKNALDSFVRRLNSASEGNDLVLDLRALGARHVYLRKEGFGPNLWYSFAVHTIELSNEWKTPRFRKRRFFHVWTQIICFIIVNMRLGFSSELESSNREMSFDLLVN